MSAKSAEELKSLLPTHPQGNIPLGFSAKIFMAVARIIDNVINHDQNQKQLETFPSSIVNRLVLRIQAFSSARNNTNIMVHKSVHMYAIATSDALTNPDFLRAKTTMTATTMTRKMRIPTMTPM